MIEKPSSLTKLISIVLGLPWVEILAEAWKFGRKLLSGLAHEGMYEALDYEATLELHDPQGKRASFKKRLHVRYLQDNIIAFQDQAWGDGKILRNYRTSRGQAVDQYKSGYKTYILLSLREIRNRGDVDEFRISWDIREGFLKPDGFWAASVSHRMRHLKIKIIFPKDRPPLRAMLEENQRRRTRMLGLEHQKRLADGRVQLTWEMDKPKLYELYVLRWDW